MKPTTTRKTKTKSNPDARPKASKSERRPRTSPRPSPTKPKTPAPEAAKSKASKAGAAPRPRTERTAAASGGAPSGSRRDAALAGLTVSHPHKVYWPDEGYTKRDLLRYYDQVFSKLEPWVADRLLSLKRCPNGLSGKCFFQKEKPETMPGDTPTKRIVHENGVRNYVVGGRLETQLALVNLGCIAVHVWGARQQNPRQPDWVCFDLDPDSGKFADAARAAKQVRAALDALGLISFPKTSGKKGLHIYVPIVVGPDCDDVRGFADRLGHRLSAAYPKDLTMESRIADRKGRVYLDPFRNGFAQTVVAPYSMRRFPRAPISTPLAWDEVDPSLDPGEFNMATFAKRFAGPDPWKDFWKKRQKLDRALDAVKAL